MKYMTHKFWSPSNVLCQQFSSQWYRYVFTHFLVTCLQNVVQLVNCSRQKDVDCKASVTIYSLCTRNSKLTGYGGSQMRLAKMRCWYRECCEVWRSHAMQALIYQNSIVLYRILCRTGSQCKSRNTGIMCPAVLAPLMCNLYSVLVGYW